MLFRANFPVIVIIECDDIKALTRVTNLRGVLIFPQWVASSRKIEIIRHDTDRHHIIAKIWWTIDCTVSSQQWMMLGGSKGNANGTQQQQHNTISQSRMSIHLIFYHAHGHSGAHNVCQFMFDAEQRTHFCSNLNCFQRLITFHVLFFIYDCNSFEERRERERKNSGYSKNEDNNARQRRALLNSQHSHPVSIVRYTLMPTTQK